MAVKTLDIYNLALMQLGEKPIMDINDSTAASKNVSALYGLAFKAVLTQYPFSCARKRDILLPDAAETPKFDETVKYKLPSKFIQIVAVFDKDGYQNFDYTVEGNYILTDLPTQIGIIYTWDISKAGLCSPELAEVVATWIAWRISMRSREKVQFTQTLAREYSILLAKAKTADARAAGPKFYGNTDIVNGPTTDNLPKTWVDARL